MKRPFQPFSIEFKPLLDEIMEREKALRELARGAAMIEILGKCPYFVIATLDYFSLATASFCLSLATRATGFVRSCSQGIQTAT